MSVFYAGAESGACSPQGIQPTPCHWHADFPIRPLYMISMSVRNVFVVTYSGSRNDNPGPDCMPPPRLPGLAGPLVTQALGYRVTGSIQAERAIATKLERCLVRQNDWQGRNRLDLLTLYFSGLFLHSRRRRIPNGIPNWQNIMSWIAGSTFPAMKLSK